MRWLAVTIGYVTIKWLTNGSGMGLVEKPRAFDPRWQSGVDP